jgi:hypothetical protein
MSKRTKGNDRDVAELFIESAKYILGESKDIPSLSGDPAQVGATRRAIEASRALYEALNDQRTSVEAAIALVEAKKRAADNFRNVTGVEWKL